MKLLIRRYREHDYEEVRALHHLALHQAGAHAGSGPWDDDLDTIPAVYRENGGEFLVGVSDGRVVAMGALKRTSATRAEVKRMRVHPDYQRRGFAQAMLYVLERKARELGYTELHLDATVQQEAALELYRRWGFRETGRGVLDGSDTILFEKKLR